jgi:hypothetical protein
MENSVFIVCLTVVISFAVSSWQILKVYEFLTKKMVDSSAEMRHKLINGDKTLQKINALLAANLCDTIRISNEEKEDSLSTGDYSRATYYTLMYEKRKKELEELKLLDCECINEIIHKYVDLKMTYEYLELYINHKYSDEKEEAV